MGLYGEQVVPRVTDRVMDNAELREIRSRVCAGLAGRVVEIGFGSGLNVAHYPASVTRVEAVEPSRVAWRLAAKRVAEARVSVQRTAVDAQALPYADASFDAALSTWTLCTIPDPLAALREVRRVLQPKGTLHLVEHGCATDPGVRRWQDRVNRLNRLVQGGCNINRPIDELLAEGGFAASPLQRYYLPGAPRLFAAIYEGAARPS